MVSWKMTVCLSVLAFLLGGVLVGGFVAGLHPDALALAQRAEAELMGVPRSLRFVFFAVGGGLVLAGLWKFCFGRDGNGGPGVGAVMALGVLVALAAEPALAKDLGDMADASGAALEKFPRVVTILLYVVGGFLVLMGFYKFKRNMDTPQNQSVMGAVVTLVVGVAMMAFPSAVEMIGGTLDLTGGGTVSRPRMQ